MEKEQKKLLLVAVSVGVFLLVALTVAMALVSHRPKENVVSSAPQPVSMPVPVIDPVIPTVIEQEVPQVPSVTDRSDGENLIIQVPAPTTAAVPETPAVVTVAPRSVTTAPSTPAVPATPAARPSQPARQTAPAAPAQSKPAAAKTINDYWIQTGAFEARIRAEDVKDTLAEKGFVSIIENREINGKIWYRVRLGPYTTQREAEYWLALVKSIDGFDQSQVRQTTRTQ